MIWATMLGWLLRWKAEFIVLGILLASHLGAYFWGAHSEKLAQQAKEAKLLRLQQSLRTQSDEISRRTDIAYITTVRTIQAKATKDATAIEAHSKELDASCNLPESFRMLWNSHLERSDAETATESLGSSASN